MRKLVMVLMALGSVCLLPVAAAAQVIGSFSWQMQPYCKVRTTATLASQSFSITVIRQSPGTDTGPTVISSGHTPGKAVYVVFSSASANVYLCAVQVHFNRP